MKTKGENDKSGFLLQKAAFTEGVNKLEEFSKFL